MPMLQGIILNNEVRGLEEAGELAGLSVEARAGYAYCNVDKYLVHDR